MGQEAVTAPIVAFYERIAATYDNPSTRFFPYAADLLVARLRPRRGEKVLDIATGTGTVATAAAQWVGGEGRVFGIDLAEGMLDVAERKARHLGLHNIDWHDMDAAAPEFRGGYFDRLACGFALHLLPDPAAALAAWQRMLRPGGGLALTLFGAGTFAPFSDRLLARLAAHGIEPPFGWNRLTGAGEVTELLDTAGFTEVKVESHSLGYHLARAEEWWEVITHTDLGRAVEALPPAQRDALEREHLDEARAAVTEEGFWVELPVLFAIAERPAQERQQ